MTTPYAQLRAQMSPAAQAEAHEKLTALRAHEAAGMQAAERAFRAWYCWHFPYQYQPDALTAWQILPAHDRAVWECVAEAVLHETP